MSLGQVALFSNKAFKMAAFKKTVLQMFHPRHKVVVQALKLKNVANFNCHYQEFKKAKGNASYAHEGARKHWARKAKNVVIKVLHESTMDMGEKYTNDLHVLQEKLLSVATTGMKYYNPKATCNETAKFMLGNQHVLMSDNLKVKGCSFNGKRLSPMKKDTP